jgi:hypothetical protein
MVMNFVSFRFGQNFSYQYANWNDKSPHSTSVQIPVHFGPFRQILAGMQICLIFFVQSCHFVYQYMGPIRNLSSLRFLEQTKFLKQIVFLIVYNISIKF